MARWENEDLTGLNIPDAAVYSIQYIDMNGADVASEDCAVAKIVSEDDKRAYYILYGRGEIVEPHQIDTNYSKNKFAYKFKKVTEDAFGAYEKYLKTKNRLYFTNARRLVMERL